MVLANQAEHALDERVAAQVAELAKGCSRSQMSFAIGVASRTAQGTFARDLDREHRRPALQNLPPGGKEIPGYEAGS